jgi:Zierdtviridae DNA primase
VKAVAPSGPYAASASGYWKYGWTPLPLPPKQKTFPPNDWTGAAKEHSNEYPSQDQIARWIAKLGNGNVCIRLPEDVIGIDVDMYEGKAGRATLAAAEGAWGALPPTWYSSSRDDGSGIRLFRIPRGLSWPGKLPQGGGVEIVRWDHRYVVCAPSIHPDTGGRYEWFTPEGEGTNSSDGWEFPEPGELPDLPDEWVSGLTSGKPWQSRTESDMTAEEVTDWLKQRGDGEMCEVMDRTLALHLNKLRKSGGDGGAHDAMNDGVWALIGDSAAGHSGIRKALERMQMAFKEAVKDRRSASERRSEWRRSLEDGVRKVAAEGEPEEEDICAYTATTHEGRRRRGRAGGSAELDYTRDDAGNGRRFALRYRDNVRYVEALGGWHIWDSTEGRWALDLDGEITRMALATVAAMEEEAEFIEDPKAKAAFRSFVRSSSNVARRKAMVETARDLKGMTAGYRKFNANPRQLVCPNGTIELLDSGVRFRPSIQEDYNTLTTGVKFIGVRGADSSPEWNKFLDRFLPDLEIRTWLQKLAGYSLLGTNPSRLMVIGFGQTSSGKTTFSQALEKAIGEYASVTSMSVFRDNQDERPRADLVEALPKRVVYAEEASQSWHLHPDQIKRLTGGAPVKARLPFAKSYVSLVPAFTPWLFTNHSPTIENADAALWRRIVVVPFDVQISPEEEDPFFEEKLFTPAGCSAILAWFAEGWNLYCADREAISTVPAGALEALARFKREVNDTAGFLDDCCDYGEMPEYFLKPAHLYEVYKVWAEEHGIAERNRLNLIMLGKYLSGMGFKRTSTKRYPGREGKPIPVIGGLRLTERWAKAVPFS